MEDHIRVPPNKFGEDIKASILSELKSKYEGFIDKEIGVIIDILDVGQVEEGVIIAGDGAAFYKIDFVSLVFRVDLQEILLGKIRDITDFGAFITMGPMEGMIHISQTMDDFVSFSKDKALQGKQSKKVLKPADLVRARMIAISFKDPDNPKFGLTMRQAGLGKLDWIAEDLKK